MNRPGHRDRGCPAAACFELLGRRWALYVLWALGKGPLRFTQLVQALPGVTDRVLSRRLKELEAAGIVTRRQYAEIPPRVEYELTERGRGLLPVIRAMERWSTRWPERGAGSS